MLLQLWEHTPNWRHSFLSKHKRRLREDIVPTAQLSRVAVPPQVRCPVFWKPGLHEQKASVPLVTQWASSPSPHCVLLLLQSFSLPSGEGKPGGACEYFETQTTDEHLFLKKKQKSSPVLQPISSEPKSSQSLKRLQRRVEPMHLWLAHKNSSFSHVGTAGGVSADAPQTFLLLQLRKAQI